jgi:hypothetical protein
VMDAAGLLAADWFRRMLICKSRNWALGLSFQTGKPDAFIFCCVAMSVPRGVLAEAICHRRTGEKHDYQRCDTDRAP